VKALQQIIRRGRRKLRPCRELATLELGRVETIRWQNEGMQQDGVLIYPSGYDASKKYPLMLYIHGGPRAATTSGFAALPQELAANDGDGRSVSRLQQTALTGQVVR
jgi:dipeptidyl aminopeptidase/acylaminoacyl peptidase